MAQLNLLSRQGLPCLQRAFDNYAAQRNFGLAHDFKHDWVLMLDADERIPDDFVAEIRSVTEQAENPVTLYRMRRKDMFMERWLKALQWLSDLVWAFVSEREACVWSGKSTKSIIPMVRSVYLEGHLIHYPFNKGISLLVGAP